MNPREKAMNTQTKTYLEVATEIVLTSGTQSERERFEAGVLPEDDLKAAVVREIWKPFHGFYIRTYKDRLQNDSVRDLAVKRGLATYEDKVIVEVVEPADEIKSKQWATLQDIRAKAAIVSANVTPFWVVAHCGELELRKTYARVERVVGDRTFKLELSLD